MASGQISAEAQHVINSLEAHAAQVADAVAKGAPGWLEEHLEALADDVREAIGKFHAALSPAAAAAPADAQTPEKAEGSAT